MSNRQSGKNTIPNVPFIPADRLDALIATYDRAADRLASWSPALADAISPARAVYPPGAGGSQSLFISPYRDAVASEENKTEYTLSAFIGGSLLRLVPGQVLLKSPSSENRENVSSAPPAVSMSVCAEEQALPPAEDWMEEYLEQHDWDEKRSKYVPIKGTLEAQKAKDAAAMLHVINRAKRAASGRAGTRGKVSNFSWRSQYRLKQELHKTHFDYLDKAKFGTLTYPPVFIPQPDGAVTFVPGGDWDKIESQLRRFTKKLLRRYPGAALYWKREYMRAGYPHLHLLMLNFAGSWSVKPKKVGDKWGGGKPDAVLKKLWHDVDECWRSVIAPPGYIKHIRTQVRPVYGRAHALSYVSKYMSKTDETPRPGRWWGRAGNVKQFQAHEVAIPLTRDQAVRVNRYMDKVRLSRARLIGDQKRRKKALARVSRRRLVEKQVKRGYEVSVYKRKVFWLCDAEEIVKKVLPLVGVVVPSSVSDRVVSYSAVTSSQVPPSSSLISPDRVSSASDGACPGAGSYLNWLRWVELRC